MIVLCSHKTVYVQRHSYVSAAETTSCIWLGGAMVTGLLMSLQAKSTTKYSKEDSCPFGQETHHTRLCNAGHDNFLVYTGKQEEEKESEQSRNTGEHAHHHRLCSRQEAAVSSGGDHKAHDGKGS